MEKINLIDDYALGILMKLAFGFIPPNDDEKISVRYIHGHPPLTKSGLESFRYLQSLVGADKFFTLTVTIDDQTVEAIKMTAQTHRNKASAADPMSSRGVGSILEKAQELDRYAKYIRRTYTLEKNLSVEDIQKLQEYWLIKDTIQDLITVSPDQLKELAGFIEEYFEKYKARLLGDQEHWALPEVYAQPILTKINSGAFIKSYGRDRVVVNGKDMPVFCHSLLYLHLSGQIKLLDLGEVLVQEKSLRRKVWQATINNLSTASEEKKLAPATTQPPPVALNAAIPLPAGCEWADGGNFKLGAVTIPFGRKAALYFHRLTDRHMQPVYDDEVYIELDYTTPHKVQTHIGNHLKKTLRSYSRISLIPTSKRGIHRAGTILVISD